MKKLLYVLSFLSFFSYFGISIFGLNAKYDQLFIALIAIIFFTYVVVIRRKVFFDQAGLFLVALCLLSIYSSYFNSPDSRYSLVQTLNLFSVALIYFIIPNILTTYDDLSDFIVFHFRLAKIWVILSTILFVFSYSTNTEVFGINLMQNESEPFGVYFTMLEPNIYGSFMLIIFCLSFVLYTSKTSIGSMGINELKTILIWSVVGLFISFTRGVWLAALIAIGWYYMTHSKNVVKTVQQVLYFSVGAIVLIYIAQEVLDIGFVKYKLTNFLSAESGTGKGRLVVWQNALDSWINHKHLFFGTGTYSFASFFNTDGYGKSNAWIGNVFLTFLHDTGIVGLFVFLLFYFQLSKSTLRSKSYRHFKNYSFVKSLNAGFLLCLMGVGIAFFFTPALTYAYPWILFGLASAFNRINKAELKTQSETNIVVDQNLILPT